MQYSKLLGTILKRDHSLLESDLCDRIPEIQSIIPNSRILVIGAAGSIDGAFVKVLSQFKMRSLHLIDISVER